MRSGTPKAAAIYARISHDPSGERLGVQRQEADCTAEAKRRGWDVAAIYVDDDRSASNARKPRPEYQRLLTDISSGVRDGVMIWRLDRLHRQPRELEEFIVLCDKHSVALATVTGDVDLATSQGRLLARAWGAFAAHECDVRGERQRRANLDRAQRGIVPRIGYRLYGYVQGTMRVRPKEAAVVRELAQRILSGESLRGVSNDMTSRRIATAAGGRWSSSTLRELLKNPALAGVSTYLGEPVGRGAWTGIITRRTSERLRLRLMDPGRSNLSGYNRSYPLRGVIRCGRCDALMVGATRIGKREYLCRKGPDFRGCGRTSVPADDADADILQRVCARLDSPQLRAVLERQRTGDEKWILAKSIYDGAQRQLRRIAREYARDQLMRTEWLAMRRVLLERTAEVRPMLEADWADTVIAEFVGRSPYFREHWPTLDRARQRMIVKAIIREVIVCPAKSTFTPAAQRLQIWWMGEETKPRRPRESRIGIAERRAVHAFSSCSVHGCNRTYLANGFCNMHLIRNRTHGDPGGAEPRRLPNYGDTRCAVDRCLKRAETKRRCGAHYMQWRRLAISPPSRLQA